MEFRALALAPSLLVAASVVAHAAATPMKKAVPPFVLSTANTGLVNHPMRMVFRTSDASSEVAVVATITLKGKLVFRSRYPFRSSGYWYTNWLPHRVGHFLYCVVGTDRHGTRSQTSCSVLDVLSNDPS